MKLHTLFTRIVQSQPADWRKIHHWNRYDTYGVCQSDIAIALAWGMRADREFSEPWATHFPDRTAKLTDLDVYCKRALVYREHCVVVDGGRCCLPRPQSADDLRVTPAYALSIRLMSLLESSFSDYPSYFRHAGLKLAELPWPNA